MRRVTFLLVAIGLIAAACGDGGDAATSATTIQPRQDDKGLNALVASYDLAAGRPQRFLVGLVTNDQQLVSFGEARLVFSFLGETKATGTPKPGPTAIATWQPIPGQDLGAVASRPRVVDGSEGTGVYRAEPVDFDRAGLWQVVVTIDVDGEERVADAAFEVLAEPAVIAPGDRAPRTENHLPGAAGVPVKAIDSRAKPDGTVPDTELHASTVAQAIATGKPTMVVVSTPVYCVSRFCGPVTDAVQQLAQRHGEQMNFVHIEVWKDFESTTMNKAAAEWILPPGSDDAREPWVWVIGADEIITHRFDNIASESELAAAVDEAVR